MAEELIISVSGMRGLINQNLTPAIAAEYGCAFGTFLKRKGIAGRGRLSVCIGRDSRPSGLMLQSAFTSGLCAAGIDVIDLDIAMTPSVGVMLAHLGCDGGAIISASHNPIQYNGIKLLLSNAMAPPPESAAMIKTLYFDKNFDLADSVNCGKVTSDDRAGAVHVEKVLKIVDKRAIASQKFKVALDSVNGAGGPVTKKLLEEFGCRVTAVNDEPTGLFAHTPEPTAANLVGFCETVKSAKVDIGFAQDPDADRLAVVDENGNYVGEEYTLALAAKYIFSKKTGKAAANLSTSRMLDDIARQRGGEVIRTPVGEANVAAAMIKNNCIIGGEGNGGVIDLRVGPIRDSLVGVALILQLMAETGKSISQLAAEIGGYCMIKDKFPADKSQAAQILDAAKKAFPNAKLNDADGLRFDFSDGWLHLRTSNTEPVMRIIVEAADKSAAENYLGAVRKISSQILG